VDGNGGKRNSLKVEVQSKHIRGAKGGGEGKKGGDTGAKAGTVEEKKGGERWKGGKG